MSVANRKCEYCKCEYWAKCEYCDEKALNSTGPRSAPITDGLNADAHDCTDIPCKLGVNHDKIR